MIPLILYYIILPLVAARLVIRLIKKYGADQVCDDVKRLLAADPVPRKSYRALRRVAGSLHKLDDFETHEEAVDRIYAAREEARRGGGKTALLVINDAGETLDLMEP